MVTISSAARLASTRLIISFAAAAALTFPIPQTATALSWQDAFEKGEEIGKRIFGEDEQRPAAERADEPSQRQPTVAAPAPASDPRPSYTPAQVREAQLLLTELGYDPGPVDGAHGSATAAAISRYQADHGLAPSGIPTRELLAHLQGTRDARSAQDAGLPVAETTAPVEAEPQPGPKEPQTSTAAIKSETVEIALPQGFKPIRLITLNGIPVAGFPVAETRGELNPANWTQADFDPDDVDARFTRLMEALYLGSEPRLLQGIAYTEAFAAKHLDEQARAEFFPSGTGSFRSGNPFGSNEFERERLFTEFLRRYDEPLRQTLPKLPFEFTYVERVTLGIYDEAEQAFPLSTRQGRTDTVELLEVASIGHGPMAIEVPDSLPMAPQAAQALLERLPDQRSKSAASMGLPPLRRAYLGLHLAVTGFTADRNGRVEVQIEPRAIGLYEDSLLTTAIHIYPVRQEEAPRMATVSAVPLLPHLANLYAVRDVEGFPSDAGILERTAYLVKDEQSRWRGLSQSDVRLRCGGKHTDFVWASASEELAGTLLRVLMYPAADWSFLDRETRFGLVPDHCVDVFVFPPEDIEGREPEFATRAMVPVYRRMLEAATDGLPKRVFINRKLPEPRYDHEREVLVFGGPPSESRPTHLLPWTSRAVEYLAPGQDSESSSASKIRASRSAEGLAIYDLPIRDNEALTPPGLQPRSVTERRPGVYWRYSIASLKGSAPRAVAVDRQLELPQLRVEPAVAEELIEDVRRSRDAMRAIIVVEVDRAESLAPDWPAILYTRLDHVVITTGDGREVAVLDAESFPDAVTAYRQANAEEQAKSEALARATAGTKAAEQARKERAAEARAAAFAACDAKPSAQERLSCYETACESRQGDYECAKKARSAYAAAVAERANAASDRQRRESQCRSRARTTWRLTRGTPDYDDFIESCLLQAQRAPYGPDILGLRLGTGRSEVDNLRLRVLNIADDDKRRHRRVAAEPLPFDEGTLNFSTDKDHFLAVYTLDNFGKPLTAVVSRRLFLGPRAQPVDALVAAMSERYGDPLWNDQRHFLWSFTEDGRPRRDAAAQACSGLVDLLVDAEWQTYSALDEEITRLAPPTLSARPSPNDYAAFADCGVVLIARFNELAGGNVGDFALTLFDPGWIAEQPTFAFTEEVEDSLEVRF